MYTALTLVSGFIFSTLSFLIIYLSSGIPIGEISIAISDLTTDRNLSLVKVLLLFNSFGLFVLPPFLFCFIYKLSIPKFFKLNELRTVQLLPILLLLFVFFLPILNITVELNKLLQLPDWMAGVEEWMRSSEDNASYKTEALLNMQNHNDLFINILLIGLLPSVGEELAFRGVIQQTLIGKNTNAHLGIWGAAFVFSFIHFQFFGFLPRLLLGAFFGYLFYWSKSLWLPILGHFINNAGAVIIAFYWKENGLEKTIEQVGTTEETNYLPVVSIILFGGMLYYFKRQCAKLLT